jgi:hypothetical protein
LFLVGVQEVVSSPVSETFSTVSAVVKVVAAADEEDRDEELASSSGELMLLLLLGCVVKRDFLRGGILPCS